MQEDRRRRAPSAPTTVNAAPDVTSRTAGVDLLNRALLSSFLPVQAFAPAACAACHPFRRSACGDARRHDARLAPHGESPQASTCSITFRNSGRVLK
jgi:hypothetical protein